MKRITILGPAWPYRGGIATFDEMLARTFAERGAKVNTLTFTVQYPSFLFPGKTQYSESPPPEDLRIERAVNSVNPLNWWKIGRRLQLERPDAVIMKYWTPFMGPCFGSIARIARGNGHTKILVQVDNIVPHEPRITDRAFNRWFVNSVDGFVYMSQQVKDDLDALGVKKPALFSPHPIFSNFGTAVPKDEACRALGLDPHMEYSLFFGLIRDYKGLDLLLDAWKLLKDGGHTRNRRLIVAGEFYADRETYIAQIARLGLHDDIILHDRFIRDDEVRYYFSAADVLIQPYKTATQSGVTQIAYNFELPMIVTDVGGLAEIVTDDVAGYVVDVSPQAIADAFVRFYADGNAARLRGNMAAEKERFTWDAMAGQLEKLYRIVCHPELEV
ncbi:MAG: glycosyltransferase [Rikenellaceae bacterium]|nr:glycosyltransferase [Rikenellaceae bacterium]MCL2692444.1 glycosyltransferase [Rikenellaceae bacterium]